MHVASVPVQNVLRSHLVPQKQARVHRHPRKMRVHRGDEVLPQALEEVLSKIVDHHEATREAVSRRLELSYQIVLRMKRGLSVCQASWGRSAMSHGEFPASLTWHVEQCQNGGMLVATGRYLARWRLRVDDLGLGQKMDHQLRLVRGESWSQYGLSLSLKILFLRVAGILERIDAVDSEQLDHLFHRCAHRVGAALVGYPRQRNRRYSVQVEPKT